MRKLIAFITAGALLGVFVGCGSEDKRAEEEPGETTMTHNEADNHSHEGEDRSSGDLMQHEAGELPSRESWVRKEPIDVKAIDVNNDGYVYQDPMDWNVIADEEGKCPTCGMLMKQVTLEEAEKNLRDHGLRVSGPNPE
jgi:hypothetical protein